jgi:hypothetical protein
MLPQLRGEKERKKQVRMAAAQHRKQVIELGEGRSRPMRRDICMGGNDAFREILFDPGNTAQP